MAIYADKKNGKPTGRWVVEVQLDGRRLRGRFDDMAQAREAEAKWKLQLAAGAVEQTEQRQDGRGAPATLRQLVVKAAPLLWNGSEHGILAQGKVEKIAELMGDAALAKIDTAWIDEVILKLRDLGKAPGTVNRYLSALHAVLAWGAKTGRGYVPVLPEFSWQDEDEGRIRWLTPAEETALVAKLIALGQPAMAAFVEVAVDTGCRRGELHGSTPADVDGAWLRLWADRTKTNTSRSVPLTPRARVLLGEHLPWSFSLSQLRYWFEKAKDALGLSADPDYCIHALRHTCATRLVERGVNLRVVQQFMGHRSIQTTLRYAHVSDDMLADAAGRLVSGGGYPAAEPGVGGKVGDAAPHRRDARLLPKVHTA